MPRLALCSLLLTSLFSLQIYGQEPKSDAEIEKLIDQLVDINRQDVGYSGSTSGQAFLPLNQSNSGAMLLFQQPSQSSETMRTLVKLGVKALPALLKHLKDDRPTKIILKHEGGFGGLWISEDHDEKVDLDRAIHITRHTVAVGDLCYVALGQIVNRNYVAVRYQPTAIIMAVSVPRSTKLREDLIKEWGKLTADQHRDSLIRDLDSDDESRRNGGSLRLAYYYPQALEEAALKQLAKPTYDSFQAQNLIRDLLYPAKTAQERKTIIDDYVKKHGEIAREGIRWKLFDDLNTQEADEQGRLNPKLEKPYQAREYLIELFGFSATVSSKDRPKHEPLKSAAQARFMQTLHFDSSIILDRSLRDLLSKTDDDFMAQGCLDRLIGRGYDADIEAYIQRRLPDLKKGDDHWNIQPYQSRLGWNRLHASVHFGVVEYVEATLQQKPDVNARGRDGRTPLHLASAEGKQAIVKILLQAQANPNIKDGEGKLPVQLAAFEDYPAVVRLLIEKKSEIPDLFTATIVGTKDSLSPYLQRPETLKQRNKDGLLPLHVAAREGQVEAVRLLLDAGADIKAVDLQSATKYRNERCDGYSPLLLAVITNKPNVVRLLLERGADVNQPDSDKNTPLHLAAWLGRTEMVKLLLDQKVNRTAKNSRDQTPLDMAKERERAEVVKLLE